MYLLDTNIFLEGLLEQENAASVHSFFRALNLDRIFITDLTLHSIGIILFRLKKHDLFISFLNDMIIGGMGILSIGAEDYDKMKHSAQHFNLDFDDAYQYTVAMNHQLKLISFDRDFDGTEIRRKEPSEVL